MPRLPRTTLSPSNLISQFTRCSARNIEASASSSHSVRAEVIRRKRAASRQIQAGPSTCTNSHTGWTLRGESSPKASSLSSSISSSHSSSWLPTFSAASSSSSFSSSYSSPRRSSIIHLLSTITSSLHFPRVQQQQVRSVTYGAEYQPSQRVRKRRHGFLARRRSRGGRKVLIRRRMKGRRYLSH